MRRELGIALYVLIAAMSSLRPSMCGGSEIWTGPPIVFEKTAFGDSSDPSQQDRITENVWITRAAQRGIYNAAVETFYTNDESPAGTEWAVGTTCEIGSLTFASWEETVGLGTPINGPPDSVGVDMVVHLITDDIFIDIEFLSWGVGPGSGAGFSYERSTPAPGLSADFNSDGDVNGADLTVWESSFGVDDGADANEDGVSDGADFLEWQRQFGESAAASSIGAVPEPAALALAAGGALLGWLQPRRRGRRS